MCYLSYMLVRVLARGTSVFLLAAVLLVAGVFLSVGPALAQNGFRVTYDVEIGRAHV